MRVFNESKTKELAEYDLELGYLREDVLETQIPEQLAVEEKFHYETIREYPNGGKDVEKVIDVESKPYIAAHVETEDILVYIRYTEEELERNRMNAYETLVESYIRERYSLSAELAILRQRDAKPEEFAEYYAYAEECKARAKEAQK
jgi:hypothetical protein